MQPIMFRLGGPFRNLSSGARRGVPPPMQGMRILPTGLQRITGIARDATGTPLAGATVTLFRTEVDDQPCGRTVSGDDGSYVLSAPYGLGATYFIVAYKTGVPDVAGTSVNTLVGV